MAEPFEIILNLPCAPSELAQSIAQADAASEALELANKRIAVCMLQEALQLHPWIESVRVSNGLPVAVGKASAIEKAQAFTLFKSLGERMLSEPISWIKQDAQAHEAVEWLARSILNDDEFNQWQDDTSITHEQAPEIDDSAASMPQTQNKPAKASLADAIRHRL